MSEFMYASSPVQSDCPPPAPVYNVELVPFDHNGPVCACNDCEHFRNAAWSGHHGNQQTQQQQQQQPAPRPQPSEQQSTKRYVHNPYSFAQPQSAKQQPAPTQPPVVGPADVLAPLVPNVAEYEVYPVNPVYAVPNMIPMNGLLPHPALRHAPGPISHGIHNGGHHNHNGHHGPNGQTNGSYRHNNHNNHNQHHHGHQNHNSNNNNHSNSNNNQPVYSLQEQFEAAIGNISEVAFSPKGRSMLQAVIRQNQTERVGAIFQEMVTSDADVTRCMLDGNACHVIRALLETVSTSDAALIANPLVTNDGLIMQLATVSQHTRRILQAIFEKFNDQSFSDHIATVLATHSTYLATTQQGCIALMRVIDNASDSQRTMIHEKLYPSMAILAMDPYGNYVIQHMIERGDAEPISQAVLTHFLPHVVHMCCNKFASNVMEKVFYNLTPGSRKTFIDSLCSNNGALQVLTHDSFGNFVIQAIIETCVNVNEFRKLTDRLRPLLPTSPFGHKIEAKLKGKRLTRAPTSPSGSASSGSSSVSSPGTPTQETPTPDTSSTIAPCESI